MAIVKNPALSLEASGNLGGICYTTHRGLQIARSAWTGTVPNTAKQVAQQALLTAVSQAWGATLTASQRSAWEKAAQNITWKGRLGDPYIPSGYQYFLKLNIRRKVMALVIMTIPPPTAQWVDVRDLRLEWQDPQSRFYMRLRQTNGLPVDGYGIEYWKAGPYGSPARHPIAGEWRFFARQIPPADKVDPTIDLLKWYWYKGRQIGVYGEVGNWFPNQAYSGL